MNFSATVPTWMICHIPHSRNAPSGKPAQTMQTCLGQVNPEISLFLGVYDSLAKKFLA